MDKTVQAGLPSGFSFSVFLLGEKSLSARGRALRTLCTAEGLGRFQKASDSVVCFENVNQLLGNRVEGGGEPQRSPSSAGKTKLSPTAVVFYATGRPLIFESLNRTSSPV